jgi:Holliday junction resolvase-like predicted endonuclease
MSRQRKESPQQRGARFELAVAVDLFRQGFAVFRPLSADGEIDLIGRKRGQLVTVQVKSEIGRAGIRRCDILAVTNDGGIVRYRVVNRRVARLLEEAKIIRKVNRKSGGK